MHKKILIIVFMLTLVALPVFSLLFMPREEKPFSENENRYLETFPKISQERLLNKNFMNGFDKWTSDMFIGRENWIIIKNSTERLLGKTDINGVFTVDGRMIEIWNDYDKELTDQTLEAMNNFATAHSETPVYFMLAPTAQEIYSDTLPANAQIKNQKNYIRYCFNNLPDITGLDISGILTENRNRYIYYRTDHHWTSLGAYLAYATAAQKMGYTAIPIGQFNVEHASNDFRGTLYSKTLDLNIKDDIIDYYILAGGDPVLTINITNGEKVEEYSDLYFREYLSVKDKYSSFLGANSPVIDIKNEYTGNERKLLIFKDSYAHCLIPFYTKNYSRITVLDMRYINVDYNTLVNVEDYDQVLFMYNVVTFSGDGNLKKLG